MTELRPARGTHDIVGEQALRHRKVVETGRAIAARYGYHEVATPVFEFTEVFARTLGETSDVVTKEMYTFEDRGGDSLTLRPEYTAGIARAFISGSLGQQLPIRLFATGPMFRYERPQKGRLRQFHQIDVEILGAPEPLADVEVIALGARILAELGLAGQVVLELNSLGDPACLSR
jgi:histidyl-tRNA synthetase